MTIKKCTFDEIINHPNFETLASEYENEAKSTFMPPVKLTVDLYRNMEKLGILDVFGVFDEETLIGFAFILFTIIPHYSLKFTISDSLFIAKTHRKTGAGLKLIKAIEEDAKIDISPGILISAPSSGPLAELLPNIGYTEINRIFFKRMTNEK